ncbi:MAG: hypothetical protein RML33_11160 [Acidobacteriota bacterium]|nr:hypothetical protein [Leptospiraceae bacterium]MDW8305379.1 hypothetical protein [Acidobacteriota bacterium]
MKSNWEIIELPLPAQTTTPVVSIKGKDFNWVIAGAKSNLPNETIFEISIPQLAKNFQSQGVPIYAILQPDFPPFGVPVRKDWQWHYPLFVPAEYELQIKLFYPISALFPFRPFLALYYEFYKSKKFKAKFPQFGVVNEPRII